MKVTVIGGKGFIGKNLIAYAKSLNLEVFAPEKNDDSVFLEDLGVVVYCAGVTSDYRQRAFDTVNAHVSYFAEILEKAKFSALVYLSSTRIYINNQTANENNDILVKPMEIEELFNLSKLMGESLAIAYSDRNIRIARISNVYGDDFKSDNFLFSIIKDAVNKRNIILRTTLDSQKDYISIEDVVCLLLNIAFYGKEKVYNVASGTNITNESITNLLHEITGCSVSLDNAVKKTSFPTVDIELIKKEFLFRPKNLLEHIPRLVKIYQQYLEEKR